jgi:preprotein translocase subunit SecF
MIARRNWLLKCSIFVNIAVLLYICSHVMVGNNTNNFGMSGSGSASYLVQQMSPTSRQQSTQQQKSSLSPAQVLQDEQELAAILRNKELELQRQIKQQEAAQVSNILADNPRFAEFNLHAKLSHH